MIAFIFQDVAELWTKIADQGIAIAVLALILFFVIILVTKILPSWERIRTAEVESVKAQAAALGLLGSTIGQLSGSLNQMGDVTKEIAVEQKKATENVLILQRVSTAQSNNLAESVDNLSERIEKLEEKMNC